MAVFFMFGGFVSLCISGAIFFVYKQFFANAHSTTLQGTIVSINEQDFKTKDAFGHVNDVTSENRPIVEFVTDQRYQFEANIDAPSKGMRVGSNVSVIINEQQYPGVAKLAEESGLYQLLLIIFAALGFVFLTVGCFLFDLESLGALMRSPLFWLVMGGVMIFLFTSAMKVRRMMRDFPLFPVNVEAAEEAKTEEK